MRGRMGLAAVADDRADPGRLVQFEGSVDRPILCLFVPQPVFAGLSPRLREVGQAGGPGSASGGPTEAETADVPTRSLGRAGEDGDQGTLIAVHPIFFSQGVNEQQTYANAIGESTVQDKINWESLLLLRTYADACRALWTSSGATKAAPARLEQAEAAINSLAVTIVGARRFKSTDILHLSERAARLYVCWPGVPAVCTDEMGAHAVALSRRGRVAAPSSAASTVGA